MTNQLHIDIGAEESVLGALLIEPLRVPEVSAQLAGEDFTDSRNRQAFEAMASLSARSQPFDLVVLGNELAQRGTFESVGGRARLAELLGRVTSTAHLLHHAEIVADAARLRRVTNEARLIADEAEGIRPTRTSTAEFLESVEQRILRASAGRSLGTLDLVERDVVRLHSLIEAGPVEGMVGLRTGILGLDEILCGMGSGDLGVVGARPSFGKSTFVGNIAMDVALREGHPAVLLFTMEMSRQSVLERLATARAGVNHYWVRNRQLSPENKQRVADALAELEHARLGIDDTGDQTIMSIRAKARRFKQRYGLALVIVDYLQLVRCPGSESRLQEVSAISRSLKALAVELNVPVIACSQLNRAADVGGDDRPRLSHLRESGTIESDADFVILLHPVSNATAPDEARKVDAIIAKNRSGPVGTAHLLFQPEYLRFVDLVEARCAPKSGPQRETSIRGPGAKPFFDDELWSPHGH